MADEKILKDNSSKDEKISNDELLNDEELEQVAGGGWIDCKIPNTTTDSNQLGNVVGKRFIPPSIC